MQKNWNKLCSVVKSCKPKMSNQGLRLTALAVLFVMSTGYCLADAGSSAITGAVGTFKGYIQPVRNLLYVIKKTIMMTIGGCAALVAMAVALPKFFGY